MKLLIKNFFNRILVITMITILLSFFCVDSVSQAKIELEEDEFYYTGVQQSEISVSNNFFKGLLNKFLDVINYFIGIVTFAIRGIIIGWLEIAEIFLTAILGESVDPIGMIGESVSAMDTYEQHVVNVEDIIFNKVQVLNANIFNSTQVSGATAGGNQSATSTKIADIIKKDVAKWYYVFFMIVIVFMLLLLLFLGIKMAISTIASQKALYKKMLVDWLAGIILLFSIHYIMIIIFAINDSFVDLIKKVVDSSEQKMLDEYEYGDENEIPESKEVQETLYQSARTRAYSLKLTDGFVGMFIYGGLIFYAYRFALIYFKRLFNVMILTLVAPVVAASFAFNKVLTGKSKVFSTWLSEYINTVIVQMVHALLYAVFLSTALFLALKSITGAVLAFILMHYMGESGKLFRQLFRISGGKGSLAGDMNNSTFKELKEDAVNMKNAMVGGVVAKTAIGVTKKAVGNTVAFGVANAVAHHKNKHRFDEKKESDYDKRIENIKNGKFEFNDEQEKLDNLNKSIENLKSNIENRRASIIAGYGNEKSAEQILKWEDELKNQEDKKKELIDNQVSRVILERDNHYIGRTLKTNLGEALNGLVKYDSKTGKYKVDRTGFRITNKNKDSIPLKFKNNLKLSKLLGLNSGEVAKLKAEKKFWGTQFHGFASAIAGTSMFSAHPMASMALLVNGMNSRSKLKMRSREYKLRRKYSTSSKYKFKDYDVRAKNRVFFAVAFAFATPLAPVVLYRNHVRTKNADRILNLNCASGTGETYKFSGYAVETFKEFSIPERLNAYELEGLEELANKRFKEIKKQLKETDKYMEEKRKQVNKNVIHTSNQFEKIFDEWKEEKADEIQQTSTTKLLMEEKVVESKSIMLGDDLCIQMKNSEAMSNFLQTVKSVSGNENLNENEKISQINQLISDNKQTLIMSSIMNLCEENNITDFNNVKLTDEDMYNINETIKTSIENLGVLDRGEINLEKADINEESISEVYLDLSSNMVQTNEDIRNEYVSSAILEYMSENNVKDTYSLNSEEAQSQIYEIARSKMIPDSSKQSEDVIHALTGSQETKVVDFSDEEKAAIELSIQNNINNVETITSASLAAEATQTEKSKLEQRTQTRDMNKVKARLEEFLYKQTIEELNKRYFDEGQSTEDITKNLNEKELEMLFALAELRKQNETGEKVKVKNNKNKKQIHLDKLLYDKKYEDYSLKPGKVEFGNRKLEQNKVTRKKENFNTQINGPAVDIVNLINKVK